MKNTITHLKAPTLISLLITLPFILLELVNRRALNEEFPFSLFIVLWTLPMASLLIIKNIQSQNQLMLILRVVSLLIIAALWIAIIQDQLPCFLGVSNCD